MSSNLSQESDLPTIILHTKNWIRDFVIQLSLCPFAHIPFREDRIRYVVNFQSTPADLVEGFFQEGKFLLDHPPQEVETSLLIFPNALSDFHSYLDFAYALEAQLPLLGWEGIIQLAQFHPLYCFDGVEEVDVSNFTNRSPFPMIHLLREDSVSKAIDQYPETSNIPLRNIELLHEMGKAKVLNLLSRIKPSKETPNGLEEI